MNNEIKVKENLLNIFFLKQAKRFNGDLLILVNDRQKRESIYADFLDMLISAQREEKTFDETIPDYDDFLSSCVESEKKNIVIKQKIIKHRKLLISIGAAVLSALLICVCLLSFDFLGVWFKGVDYIYRSEKYVYSSHILIDELEFDLIVDDSKFDLNNGKEIYNDGVNKVFIESVDYSNNMSASDTGSTVLSGLSWRIKLKCVGLANRNFAQIVCGADYGKYKDEAVFVYELGDKFYTNTSETRPFPDFKNCTETILRIDSHEGFFSNTPEEAEKFEAMQKAEKITIKLNRLILNQWIRK